MTSAQPASATRPVIPRLDGNERPDWASAAFRADVLAGFARVQKQVPPKYLYDRTGTALFEQICELFEYYPTRAELDILSRHADAMAALIGPEATLVELGSGSSLKTRLLLDRLTAPHAYVPVDIAEDALAAAARALHKAYPGLLVQPVRADFTLSFVLPPAVAGAARLAVFFPGSTIGNLEPHEAVLLMRKVHRRLPEGGVLIVGVDTRKDPAVLERAYNDSRGVTAAFNRNLLARMRTELETDIDPDAFEHWAYYNAVVGRVEMHLRARAAHTVRLEGRPFPFRRGETVHTESSYKYAPADFAELARRAGFTPAALWPHDEGLFAVHGLVK